MITSVELIGLIQYFVMPAMLMIAAAGVWMVNKKACQVGIGSSLAAYFAQALMGNGLLFAMVSTVVIMSLPLVFGLIFKEVSEDHLKSYRWILNRD